MTQPPGEVTRADVENLWSLAIAGTESWNWLIDKSDALIRRANSENPVVNWGLVDLYHRALTEESRGAAALTSAYTHWHAQLSGYDADPATWMRSYYQGMIADFAARHGHDRARSFGRKLSAHGLLSNADIDDALRRAGVLVHNTCSPVACQIAQHAVDGGHAAALGYAADDVDGLAIYVDDVMNSGPGHLRDDGLRSGSTSQTAPSFSGGQA